MHDIAGLEALGVPGAFVASTEFRSAAEAQSSSLGFEPEAVFVPHPIQDRTDEELRKLADDALGSLVRALTGSDEAA